MSSDGKEEGSLGKWSEEFDGMFLRRVAKSPAQKW